MKNYYEILDVSCDVDPEDLKKAYRRMAKKYHPDHQPEDTQAEERFKDLQEAYEVLSDPARRDRYDVVYLRARARGPGGASGYGRKRSRGGGVSHVPEFVEDIYERIKSRMGSKGKRGEDHRYMLTLSLEEAARGVKKVIHIPRQRICSSCRGRGWNSAGGSNVCGVCRGEGEVTIPRGGRRETRQCPGCEGEGLSEKILCKRCKGKGRTSHRLRRSVEIPAGVDNGSRLKICGDGAPGKQGGENGDLYIIVQVKDHRIFKRKNLDIWTDVSLHFTQAALGAEIHVPTLDGERPLKVPPGTQAGEIFVLKGYGIPGMHGAYRGDQKGRVQVQVPRKMTREERELLKSWKEMEHSEG